MKNRTTNYEKLGKSIKTTEQACVLEEIIVKPYTYVERAALLLSDFVSNYFETKESVEELISHLNTEPRVIKAHLESILEHIETAERMLDECCDYRPERN